MDYFLMSFLIATSANPYFFDSNEFLIVGCALSGWIFLVRNKTLDINLFKVAALFFIMEVLQYLTFGVLEITTFISVFVKLAFAYFVVRCLEGRFFKYYIHTMYAISLISLFFYLISYIPGVYDFLYYYVADYFVPPYYKSNDFYVPQRNIIIFTLTYECFLTFRNPGPFWEPGIFAVFLILALLLNIIRENSLRSRTNLVFTITILSTISTAGYLALFLLFFFYFLSSSKVKFKLFYLAIVSLITLYLYSRLTFLSEKVSQNLELSDYTGSRFGSLMADWELFKENPWIGWGRGSLRYGDSSQSLFTQDQHRNNGLAAIITQYGIIFTIFYFFLFHLSFRMYSWLTGIGKRFAFLAFSVVLFISFSQVIYTRQFFLCFLFLGIHLRKCNPVIRKVGFD